MEPFELASLTAGPTVLEKHNSMLLAWFAYVPKFREVVRDHRSIAYAPQWKRQAYMILLRLVVTSGHLNVPGPCVYCLSKIRILVLGSRVEAGAVSYARGTHPKSRSLDNFTRVIA